MDVKEYYRSGRRSKWKGSPMRQHLFKEIIMSDMNADSILEFGCGRGESLRLLQELGYEVMGLDINPEEVAHAKACFLTVFEGDENYMERWKSEYFDVSFTIGVMDHLTNESFNIAMKHLDRITKNTIFCLETNDKIGKYYFPHNYGSVGFEVRWMFQDTGDDGAKYVLWRKDVNSR